MYNSLLVLVSFISTVLALRSPYRYTFPDGKVVGIAAPPSSTFNLRQMPVPPIKYRKGGKIMKKANVYNIFYGTESQKAIVNDFISSIGASEWYATNTKYYQESGENT